ncbi:MAG: zf-HC2 domain-containing protein [Bdellovibrionota bacterium]
MISCKRSTELISKAAEGALSRAESAGLWLHLLICKLCRDFRRLVVQARHHVRADGSTGNSPQLSLEAKNRMKRLIEGTDADEE